MGGTVCLFPDANIPLSLIFEQQPLYPKCKKFRDDVCRNNLQCLLTNVVSQEIDDVFKLAVRRGGDVIRRLVVHISAVKGATVGSLIEATKLEPNDKTSIEVFFDEQYRNAEPGLPRDLIRHSETWVVEKLEERFRTEDEVLLIHFLQDLVEEHNKFYIRWNDRRVKVLNDLNCQCDTTEPAEEDLKLVGNMNLSENIRDKDQRILATLYRIQCDRGCKTVFASTDYAIVAERNKIESVLGIIVSDPLYAVGKL